MREINHPLTGIHNIVRESTTSRKRHDITQRLTSHILETVHGWLTAHTTVYNKERGHTLLAREYDESTPHLSKSVTKTFEFPQKNGLHGLKGLVNPFKTRY